MDIRPEILVLVLACALVTVLPRVLPLVVLARVQLPALVMDWLRYVPLSVLAALLTLELMGTGLAGLIAIAAALAIAWASGSLLGTVVAGVALFRLLA